MNICVYGAASDTIDPLYLNAGEILGEHLAQHSYTVVFGGGAAGMMGAVARGMHRHRGVLIGIAPSFFKVDGVLFNDCTELIYTDTMRERKRLLEDKSDAFLVTPGGVGTFDEFFEVLSLRQLGRHVKPIIIYNINDYFKPLLTLLDSAISQGFMKEANRSLYVALNTPQAVTDYIEGFQPQRSGFSEMPNFR